jgi:predicted negative regulator of RcsB-dependent stress response
MSAGGSVGETQPLDHEVASHLEADVVNVAHDDRYLYAACRDLKVRVWSKGDWQLVAELGDTITEPLAVHVDEEQVFATCERRVYVWKKETWGMTGWFELTYPAVTSSLQGDLFYVGAKEGRLVSIKKDTHETSSWQLHKNALATLWTDDKVIVTGSKKEEPRVWLHRPNTGPTELARLDTKIRPASIVGNNEFIIVGTTSGEIGVWNRVEWHHMQTLQEKSSNVIVSMWANAMFLVAAMNSGLIAIWDLTKGNEIGRFMLEVGKVEHIDADHSSLYVATSTGVQVVSIMQGEVPFDLNSTSDSLMGISLLRTSPYDVLESVLVSQRKGDASFEEGKHHDAVAAYEEALQNLIDNTHALLEVPEERQKLTEELNDRLGRALLKSKIQDLAVLSERIREVSELFRPGSRTRIEDDVIDKLWDDSAKAIKESRVLSEAQAGDILSYQLTDVADTLAVDLENAMKKVNTYRETVNKALTLTHGIMNEWRWMERKKTSLPKRKAFLEDAMSKISERLKEAEPESEVEEILSTALSEHRRVYEQISRIIDAAEIEPSKEFVSKEEAEAAIEGLLRVLPKRRDAIAAMEKSEERKLEMDRLKGALEKALGSAKRYKLKEQQKLIQEVLTGPGPPKPKERTRKSSKKGRTESKDES